ncbi:MAG: M28 family metallopeptidase [Bacteriovoracia bacterium]
MKTLLVLLFSLSAFAHDGHDWREDYEAYLSVVVDNPLKTKVFRTSVKRIDMEFFKEKLSSFAAIERKSNESLDKSRELLKTEYEKIGFEVSFHPFGTGTNFIAEKKGVISPEKILILSSHIDSVGNKGANDNGTGTIGVLAVARELAKKDYAFTIRVLGFDREERGLLGSDAYVASLADKKNIIGDINFEMMGYHKKNDGGFHLIDCERPFIFNKPRLESEFLSQEVKNSIQNLGLDLHVVKTCTNRSDHASFWRHNIPAIVISENFFGGDADPCYHSRCDVVDERLNYNYMSLILEAVLDASEKLLH